MTSLNIVASATACVQQLRCDEEFNKVWGAAVSTEPRRRHKAAINTGDYVFLGTTGHRDGDDRTELKRVYYSIFDSVLGEMDDRFSENNLKLAHALFALNPESDTFLDGKAIMHIMNLTLC